MTTTLEALQYRLVELRAFGQRLSEAMTQAAVELRDHGLEVAPGLLADMERFRTDFRALRDRISVCRKSLSRASSLDELERELSQQAAASVALHVIDRAAALRHRDPDSFAPLERVAEECDRLRDAVAAGPSDVVEALARGEHPLAMLVSLVTEGDRLSDDRWEQLHDAVTTRYGRELATAVARGRVMLAGSTSAA